MTAQTATADFLTVAPKNLDLPLMTFEEFLEWGDGVHAEWVDGKVIFSLPVSNRHQFILGFLIHLLREWTETTDDKGAVLFAPSLMRCRVGGAGREPDLMYLREENRGRILKNHVEGAADIAVEIVSTESVLRDFMDKFAEYEADGVGEYWIIDPATGVAEFYIRDTPDAPHFRRATLTGATTEKRGIYTCETLSGLRIDVD